ncbi:pirin family protein [Pokkaliibacter plantistimulans]|uniref:pirin family protein n=1 Tax=Pokkaliibacter plantistimulans TaxID=1635171 RepID=UPI0026D5267B|nr:pirin family protein [Pokkaliibacter plantistimulans]
MSAPTFPMHTHIGLSAVSYVFLDSETGIHNQDSLGTSNLIKPGGLHWTTAGTGIAHEEVPAEPGKTVHSLQIFVQLPNQGQGVAPAALSLEPHDVPVIQQPGVRIRVVLGQFGSVQSPLLLPTPITLLDIALEQGAELELPVSPQHGAFVLPVYGTTHVDAEAFAPGDLRLPVMLPAESSRSIHLRADQGSSKAVLFSGLPLSRLSR